MGLVPFFTKEFSDIKGLSTINARAECITKAPTWREPMKKRRCIVPASSFYGWEKAGKTPKTSYSFELANGQPIGFAGLWDAWRDKQGHWLQSFAIVTTEGNELMSRVHPRMPVILHPRDFDRWLDRAVERGKGRWQMPSDIRRNSSQPRRWSTKPGMGREPARSR